MLIFLWIMGTLASLAFWGYMKGRADTRFRDNRGSTENPPYLIGMLTSPFWVLQLPLGLIWALCFLSIATGKGDGIKLNQELDQLRGFASDYKKHEARTFQWMLENHVDPGSLDDQTTRALTARSIQWSMEDDAARKREEAGLPAIEAKVEPVNDLFEILDKAGVPVSSPSYDKHLASTKGLLDL